MRSSPGRLQAGWGMRGWAGKKSQKKSQLEKSKKVKCADPSLGGLLEATKRQKKVKSGKSKKESKKKKTKKSPKKNVKCENQARILALADYWRQQKVKKSQKKVEQKSILLATLGPDRAGYLGLWGGYQGHQGQGWLGAEETLGQWLGVGRGPGVGGWGWLGAGKGES